ncbi:MAG: 4-hydroxy-3-methylbut-2-enyl diphosphate reductase [Verrucomicrobiales bacterium]|nr:4-hydroxy-3-methylbut-2-enyl diphosphate reductase [Verrucomicrobiales bacterium]
MSTPRKVNLRTPEVMSIVQAQVEEHYRSRVVDHIRQSGGHTLTANGLTVKLAKAFGFCYGVERAIDLAYAAAKYFHDKNIYLLGEIIHNPEVNDQLREMNVKSLKEGPNGYDLTHITHDDVVIVPAFGAPVETMNRLAELNCAVVDTTCGDVMSVWKRVRQYHRDHVTSIIHGKAWHEETKATSSRALGESANTGHYLVVFTLAETDYVCNYIRNGGDKAEFLKKFDGAYSPGFDPDIHLNYVGVANQTTMMRNETEEVQNRIRSAIADRFGAARLAEHFRFFDTICGATQERQDALSVMLAEPMDLLIVVGGYNSSNTSHLAEMGEAKLPTYFIKNASKMESPRLIHHWNQHTNIEEAARDWLPDGAVVVGVTAGASCPNNLIEEIIHKLYAFRGVKVEDLIPA